MLYVPEASAEVFHAMRNGALVQSRRNGAPVSARTSAPIGLPSRRNCTAAAAALSEALAERCAVPDTAEPFAGADMATVGARLSSEPPMGVLRSLAISPLDR